jgi:hypothetical protein
MVEVMVVIAILALLASIIIVATMGYRQRAAVAATKALVQRIDLALQKYRELTGEYPPDGLDFEVRNDEGVAIRGSACLHHFLSRDIEAKIESAGETRTVREPPPMDFKEGELAEDPENPGVFEVIDSFGTPIHYDNTEDGRFVPQDGTVHMPEILEHPPDPRESVDYGVVTRSGIQGKGFDIWSHGAGYHRTVDLEENLKKILGSWNLKAGDV